MFLNFQKYGTKKKNMDINQRANNMAIAYVTPDISNYYLYTSILIDWFVFNDNISSFSAIKNGQGEQQIT